MTGTDCWIKHKGLIIVQRVPLPKLTKSLLYGQCASYLCNPVQVTFMEEWRGITNWEVDRVWVFWLYQRGYDQGLLFFIQRSINLIQGSQLIGPLQLKLPMTSPHSGAPFSLSPPGIGAPYPIPVPLEGKDLILSTMHLTFQMLNQMWPDIIDSCWLCLLHTPPFYEASGIRGGYLVEDSPSKCRWKDRAETHLAGQIFPLDMTNMTCLGASEPNWGE